MANEQIFRTSTAGARHALAAAAITPGDLVEVIAAAGADLGKVQPHATASGRAAPLFADGNWQFGKGQDDAYAAGDTVPYRAPSVGEAVLARCASGVAITVGTPLESAGAGLLRAVVTTGVIIAEALEAELASSDPTPGRILVRIVAQ